MPASSRIAVTSARNCSPAATSEAWLAVYSRTGSTTAAGGFGGRGLGVRSAGRVGVTM